MSDRYDITVDIRPWAAHDLDLLIRLMGDPMMTEHLGGPESPHKIRERQERYEQSALTGCDPVFVIVVGTERVSAGSMGYWQKAWRNQPVWETGWSVLPAFQGHGIATQAITKVVERARAERKHRCMHAFPSVANAASNAICRKAGFLLQGQVDFEYPPGQQMRCNDWRFDLFAADSDAHPKTMH